MCSLGYRHHKAKHKLFKSKKHIQNPHSDLIVVMPPLCFQEWIWRLGNELGKLEKLEKNLALCELPET